METGDPEKGGFISCKSGVKTGKSAVKTHSVIMKNDHLKDALQFITENDSRLFSEYRQLGTQSREEQEKLQCKEAKKVNNKAHNRYSDVGRLDITAC